jgi:hypothetical protein
VCLEGERYSFAERNELEWIEPEKERERRTQARDHGSFSRSKLFFHFGAKITII